MNYLRIEQNSPEWWAYKVGKVSGTRFGKLISGRENMLVDELAAEILEGAIYPDDYITDDMQFGIDNEPVAIDLYEKQTGIKFERGGVIQNPTIKMHMASPDAVNLEREIVVEVKCTRNVYVHLNRFRKGIESKHIPQCINYFASDPLIKEVHCVSYCPFRTERELVVIVLTRGTIIESKTTIKNGTINTTIQDKVNEALALFPELERETNELVINFKTIKF